MGFGMEFRGDGAEDVIHKDIFFFFGHILGVDAVMNEEVDLGRSDFFGGFVSEFPRVADGEGDDGDAGFYRHADATFFEGGDVVAFAASALGINDQAGAGLEGFHGIFHGGERLTSIVAIDKGAADVSHPGRDERDLSQLDFGNETDRGIQFCQQ